MKSTLFKKYVCIYKGRIQDRTNTSDNILDIRKTLIATVKVFTVCGKEEIGILY